MMDMKKAAFSRLYWDFLDWCRSLNSTPWFPMHIECIEHNPNLLEKSEDVLWRFWDEKEAVEALFADQGKFVDQLRVALMENLKSRAFEDSFDVIAGLGFLHSLGAKARWKYQLSVPADFAAFIRSYDRLDLLEERQRLFAEANEVP